MASLTICGRLRDAWATAYRESRYPLGRTWLPPTLVDFDQESRERRATAATRASVIRSIQVVASAGATDRELCRDYPDVLKAALTNAEWARLGPKP